jgi:hypothetical protein
MRDRTKRVLVHPYSAYRKQRQAERCLSCAFSDHQQRGSLLGTSFTRHMLQTSAALLLDVRSQFPPS